MEREMRSQLTFDRHLYTQLGLDSGALTMLGALVHSFEEAGEYRGTARRGDLPEATFRVSVDPDCAIAQADIDLAALVDDDDRCGDDVRRFTVHPRGFAVFRVSKGSGGYWVNVRRADEDRAAKATDSGRREQGDISPAMWPRPGRYSTETAPPRARGGVTVAYPTRGKPPHPPPPPLEAECGETIKPKAIHL